MRKLFSVVLLCAAVVALNAAEYEVASPDGKVRAKVICDKGTSYTLSCNGLVLIENSPISLTLSDGTVWGEAKVR